METRSNNDFGKGYQNTLFKNITISEPELGQIKLSVSVSLPKQRIECILRAFPKSLTPEKTESRIEHIGEYLLSENDINRLFQDIENILKKYPYPEQHFHSFNIYDNSDSTNRKFTSRIEANGILITNNYIEKILKIQKESLLFETQTKAPVSSCRIL